VYHYGQFCTDYPELCYQPYTTGAEMISEMCAAGNDTVQLCNAAGELDFSAVCSNTDMWPERVNRKTSFSQLCYDFDYQKACSDPQFKDAVCPSGIGLGGSLCALYPERCAEGSATKECTENVYDCLGDTNKYHYGQFCSEFNELCYQSYPSGFDMVSDLCANGYCFENQPNIWQICDDYRNTPGSIQRRTEFHVLCHDLDYEKMCTDEKLRPTLCPNGRGISSDWCQKYPESCDQTASNFDPCASNIYDCIASRQAYWGYFSGRYPELKKVPE
jgi:hypothetical protein